VFKVLTSWVAFSFPQRHMLRRVLVTEPHFFFCSGVSRPTSVASSRDGTPPSEPPH
jgi:hypothetical protein